MSTNRDRAANAIWTITGDYDIHVKEEGHGGSTDTDKVIIGTTEIMEAHGMSKDDAERVNVGTAAHEASHMMHSDRDALVNYVKRAKAEGKNAEISNHLGQLFEDERIDQLLADERPGYIDLRRTSDQAFIKLFKDPGEDEIRNTLKAASGYIAGIDMSELWGDDCDVADLPLAKELAEDVLDNAPTAKNSAEALKMGRKWYSKLVPYDLPPEGEGDGDDGDSGSDSSDDTDDSSSGGDGVPMDKGDEPTSESDDGDTRTTEGDEIPEDVKEAMDSISDEEAEKLLEDFMKADPKATDEDKEDMEDTKKKLEGKEASYERMYDQSVKYEDKSSYTGKPMDRQDDLKFNKAVQTHDGGVHDGCFVVKYNNMSKKGSGHVSRSSVKVNGDIKRLEGYINELMRQAREVDVEATTSGVLNRARLYRHGIDTQPKIFNKYDDVAVGGYFIEILLDASGSIGGRASSIRESTYIVVKALRRCGIKFRVAQFDNSTNVTRFTVLADSSYPAEYDEGIKNYQANHDNRDVIAIMRSAYELMKEPEEHKVLLMFSDGEPADGSSVYAPEIVKDHRRSTGKFKPYYHGGNEIIDVANLVRQLRKEMTVFGVYLGSSPRNHRLMFGNDFVPIKHMDGFIPAMKRMLKELIKG